MISHLQSMFGILGCFTVLTQHICNKSKFRHITSSVMYVQCVIKRDNCDSDQTGRGLFFFDDILTKEMIPLSEFLLGDILTNESLGCSSWRFVWREQGLVWLCWCWRCNDVCADFPSHLLQWSKFLFIY